MNILWVNKISDNDCWKTTQLELTNSLTRRGHDVTLVMSKSIGERKTKNNNIVYLPTISHSFLSGIIFGLIVLIYSPYFIRKKKIDFIIIDGTSVLLPFCLTMKIFDIPLIIDVRDYPDYKKKPLTFDISLHLSKYAVDGLTTITPELKDILRKEYGITNKEIGIWPSGVSIDKFIVPDSNKKEQKKFVLMHHGSYKGLPRGVENLIRSIAELDPSLKKTIKLRLVGIEPEDQKNYLQMCRELNIVEQIELISRVEYEKIPAYIQTADAGVIPLATTKKCWQVSVPLKTLEYLAMAKPIIATNIYFHKRVFEKGNCGLLIDSNDVKVLADAITHMYKNRKKLKAMGKTGRNIIENNYTWDIIAKDVETFINNISKDYKK